MKTWIVKAIDVPTRDARLPFWKITHEVTAANRQDAKAAGQALLHRGCVIKSVSVKR